MNRAIALLGFTALLLMVAACEIPKDNFSKQIKYVNVSSPKLPSLADLSIETFRSRKFKSEIKVETRIDGPCADPDKVTSLPNELGTYKSYMASYKSDGLRVYTRINVPDGPEPKDGFPVIVFAHGWVGADAAPSYTLGCDPKSMYSEITDAYARAGYVVFIPGYRGHATVNGIPGEGIEYIKTWDNGTYLSTMFYAVDVMNLMAGLQSGVLESEYFDRSVQLQADQLNLSGHSQGGDVALAVLAATGENAVNGLKINKGIVWSGTMADRLTQMKTYHPLQKTTESFISGDGIWTGSATGKNGEVNPNFIFAYPPDWMETPHIKDWTWQKETWSFPSVEAVMEDSLAKTYVTLNAYVEDISDATFNISANEKGKIEIEHDLQVKVAMDNIGGFHFSQYIKEPLILHFPDRDFYSLPAWNYDLCARVNKGGGGCTPFEYLENTHGMRVSKHAWFSGLHATEGYAVMVARDIAFFRGSDPSDITFPPETEER